MVSDNRLLGSGKIHTPTKAAQTVEVFQPMWMFHKDHPEGEVVTKQVRYDKLIVAGWVDHPGKCTLLPGLEKWYEGGENKIEEVKEIEEEENTEKVEEEEEVEVEEEPKKHKTAKQKKLFDPDK